MPCASSLLQQVLPARDTAGLRQEFIAPTFLGSFGWISLLNPFLPAAPRPVASFKLPPSRVLPFLLTTKIPRTSSAPNRHDDHRSRYPKGRRRARGRQRRRRRRRRRRDTNGRPERNVCVVAPRKLQRGGRAVALAIFEPAKYLAYAVQPRRGCDLSLLFSRLSLSCCRNECSPLALIPLTRRRQRRFCSDDKSAARFDDQRSAPVHVTGRRNQSCRMKRKLIFFFLLSLSFCRSLPFHSSSLDSRVIAIVAMVVRLEDEG